MPELRFGGAVHEWRPLRKLGDGRYWQCLGELPAEFEAFVGSCSCGWQSPKEFPPSASGASDAYVEWCDEHTRPLLMPLARREAASRVNPALSAAVGKESSRFPKGLPGAAYLVDLVALSTVAREVERSIEWRVRELREAGVGWPAIAAALGLTEKVAKEKFGPPAERKGRSNKGGG